MGVPRNTLPTNWIPSAIDIPGNGSPVTGKRSAHIMPSAIARVPMNPDEERATGITQIPSLTAIDGGIDINRTQIKVPRIKGSGERREIGSIRLYWFGSHSAP